METERFYIDPIKEKVYNFVAHLSPSGVIDEDSVNILLNTLKSIYNLI